MTISKREILFHSFIKELRCQVLISWYFLLVSFIFLDVILFPFKPNCNWTLKKMKLLLTLHIVFLKIKDIIAFGSWMKSCKYGNVPMSLILIHAIGISVKLQCLTTYFTKSLWLQPCHMTSTTWQPAWTNWTVSKKLEFKKSFNTSIFSHIMNHHQE